MDYEHVSDVMPVADATNDMLADFLFGWGCYPLDEVDRLRFFCQLREIVTTAAHEAAARELEFVRGWFAVDNAIKLDVAIRCERLRLLESIRKGSLS